MRDLWTTRDLPVLTAYAELDAGPDADDLMNAGDAICADLGIDSDDHDRSIDALTEAGYLTSSATFGGAFVTGLTEKGRRAAGSWPSESIAAERLVAALAAIADDPARTDKDRSKARKAAKWLGGAVNTLGIEVAAGVITGQLPGQ